LLYAADLNLVYLLGLYILPAKLFLVLREVDLFHPRFKPSFGILHKLLVLSKTVDNLLLGKLRLLYGNCAVVQVCRL